MSLPTRNQQVILSRSIQLQITFREIMIARENFKNKSIVRITKRLHQLLNY